MRLTRKKAIELCIEAWTIHAKTGCKKSGLPEKHRGINSNCWFCEYGIQRESVGKSGDRCDYCPYQKKYKIPCYSSRNGRAYYVHWNNARFSRTRKKYAKLFLEQIKTLR